MGSSIFDWPEQIHTSPTSTPLTVIWLIPAMSRSYGPPALVGGRTTTHRRSGPVTPLYAAPLKRTVICSPGVAQPHILMGASLCSTMPLLTRRGTLTWPKEDRQPGSIQQQRMKKSFLLFKPISFLQGLNILNYFPCNPLRKPA